MKRVFVPPVGIRQNNPGNVKKSAIDWLGEVSSSNSFEAMDCPLNGVRLLMMNALSKYVRKGLRTLGALIDVLTPDKSRCPQDGNDTASYIAFMCGYLGVRSGDDLCLLDKQNLIRLAKGITIQEQGRPPKDGPWPPDWYDDTIYDRAADLSLAAYAKYAKPASPPAGQTGAFQQGETGNA